MVNRMHHPRSSSRLWPTLLITRIRRRTLAKLNMPRSWERRNWLSSRRGETRRVKRCSLNRLEGSWVRLLNSLESWETILTSWGQTLTWLCMDKWACRSWIWWTMTIARWCKSLRKRGYSSSLFRSHPSWMYLTRTMTRRMIWTKQEEQGLTWTDSFKCSRLKIYH